MPHGKARNHTLKVRMTEEEREDIKWLSNKMEINESETVRFIIRFTKRLYDGTISLTDVLSSSKFLRTVGEIEKDKLKHEK